MATFYKSNLVSPKLRIFLILAYVATSATFASPLGDKIDQLDNEARRILLRMPKKFFDSKSKDLLDKREEKIDINSFTTNTVSENSDFLREKNIPNPFRPSADPQSKTLPIKRRFAETACTEEQSHVTSVCQNCAKITRAIGALEECCSNRRNAYKWCKRIYDFTHPLG